MRVSVCARYAIEVENETVKSTCGSIPFGGSETMLSAFLLCLACSLMQDIKALVLQDAP